MTAAARGGPRTLRAPWRVRDVLLVILGGHVLFLLLLVGWVAAFSGWLHLRYGVAADLGWVADLLNRPPWFDLLLIVQFLVTVLLLWRVLLRPHRLAVGALFRSRHAAADDRYALRLFLRCIGVSILVLAGMIGGLVLLAWALGRESGSLVGGYLAGLERETEVLFPQEVLSQLPSANGFRLLLVVLVGPPIEELLYRGGLYGALRRSCRPWQANMISSAVFALSHAYVFGLPNIVVIGVLTAYAYERTRSLRAPVLFHMLWNALAATAFQPVMWIPLAGALAWLWRSGRRAAPPGPRLRPGRTDRRLGWKLYAWLFVGIAAVSYALSPGELWVVVVEAPAYLAVVAYAYRGRLARPRAWAAYGVVYAPWVVLQLAQPLQADALAMLTRALPVGTPEAVAAVSAVGVLVLVLAVFAAPSVVVIWRLACGGREIELGYLIKIFRPS